MLMGLYSAAGGMLALEARQEAIANNIANAATPGYKRHQPVQLGFYEIFTGKTGHPARYRIEAAPAGGVKVVETYPDLRDGIMQETGNPLHVALQGPGFLVVDTPHGERYTRGGSFSIDGDGELSDEAGYKIQSVEGAPLQVSGGTVNIAQDGTVTVDGNPAGRIRLVEFEDPAQLMRGGDGLYRASDQLSRQRSEASSTQLTQGRLEMSNVALPVEMVQLMMGARAYEANQRMMSTVDATLGRLIDQVAMPS
jgi:flagellar basal-body rod protein FlgF